MYILGGRNDIDLNDVFVFDPATESWFEIEIIQRIPKPRRRHTAVFIASSLIIFGGFDGCKWLNDICILDIGKLEENEINNQAVTNLIVNMRTIINNPTFADVVFLVE